MSRNVRSFYFVLIKDNLAAIVDENDPSKIDELETQGWLTVFDSARSEREGRAYAAMLHHALDPTYTDADKPVMISEPKVLYKAVSMSELADLFQTGSLGGRPDAINDFDTKPFMMFGDKISPQLIAAGDSLERQAEIALRDMPTHVRFMEAWKAREYEADKFLDALQKLHDQDNKVRIQSGHPAKTIDASEAADFVRGNTLRGITMLQKIPQTDTLSLRILNNIGTIDKKLQEISEEYLAAEKEWIETERDVRQQYPYTSVIIQTSPLAHGYCYSKALGGHSELGDLNEYGFYPDTVASDHIVRLHCVQDGTVVRKIDLEDIPSFVQEMDEAVRYVQSSIMGMSA